MMWKFIVLCFIFVCTFMCQPKVRLAATGASTQFKNGRNIMRGLKLLCHIDNAKLIETFDCSIQLINRTAQLYNLEMYTKPNVSVGWIHARITTHYKYTVKYRKTLISLDEDICGLLDGSNNSPLMSRDVRAQSSNVLKGCPFSGHIFLHNYEIQTDFLAKLLPTGNWRLDLEFYSRETSNHRKEIPLFSLEIYYEVRRHYV